MSTGLVDKELARLPQPNPAGLGAPLTGFPLIR
jgi:hypothetical protein